MILAPWSWNLAPSGSLVSSTSFFQVGNDAGKCTDRDPWRLTMWRGPFIVTTSNRNIDFNDGAARVGVVATGTYYSPMQLAIAVAAAMNAVSSNWRCRWLQDSSARYRFEVYRSSGTASLQIASGANTATNCLKLLMGFRNEDRSAAASHTGDFAACHGPSDVSLILDLGAANGASGAVVINPRWSPGGNWWMSLGTTSAASDVSFYAGHAFDDEVMLLSYGEAQLYRYAALHVSDPRREDAPRVGLGGLFHGPWIDTDQSDVFSRSTFEWSSYRRQHVVKSGQPARGRTGAPHLEEVGPGVVLTLAWTTEPGLGPDQFHGLYHLARSLGKEEYLILAADPDGEPHRETLYCRMVSDATFTRIPTESRLGRHRFELQVERVEIR